MRNRLTIVTMLAAGLVVSGTGAGLAYQGLAYQGLGESGNAGAAQYGESVTAPSNQPAPAIGILGEPPPPTGTTPQPGRGQAERPVPVGPPPAVEVDELQEARQVEAGSSLAFTGFAAIPLLMLGAVLLVTGLVLLRNSPREADRRSP